MLYHLGTIERHFLRLPGLVPDKRGSEEGDHPAIYTASSWQMRVSTQIVRTKNGVARWCSPQLTEFKLCTWRRLMSSCTGQNSRRKAQIRVGRATQSGLILGLDQVA